MKRTLKKRESIIVLVHIVNWRQPIQAFTIAKNRFGKLYHNHWFSEWDTFKEAIKWLRVNHDNEIIVDEQIKLDRYYNPIIMYK